jgi:hypothetical protein
MQRTVVLIVVSLLLPLAACAPEARERMEVLGKLEHLDAPAALESSEPNLAVGPDGVVYLTWLELRADSSHVFRFATLRGEEWSPARAIVAGSDWSLSDRDIPSLLVLPGGRMVAQFVRRPGAAGKEGAHGVRLLRSDDGGSTWSRPVAPHLDSASVTSGFASLFPAGGDSVGVVWTEGPRDRSPHPGSPGPTLRYAALARDGGMGAGVVLDEAVCGCAPTSVAVTDHGPIVAYRDGGAGATRDVYLARRVDGRWLPGRPVRADGWMAPTCPAHGPALDADGDRVVVAWFTAARDTARVLAAFSEDGGATFGRAVRVDGGSPAGGVAVALLDGGGALVSWVERLGADTTEVEARLVSAAGSQGNPVLIAGPEASRASGPARMVRSGSDVLFTWTRAGKHPRVEVARIESGESQ